MACKSNHETNDDIQAIAGRPPVAARTAVARILPAGSVSTAGPANAGVSGRSALRRLPFGGKRHPGGPFAATVAAALIRLLVSLVQAGTALGVSALGDAIGVDQPRASRLVSQGVELGFLRREADPDDARRTLIALTDKGRAITNRFRGAQRENVDQALSEFTEEERAQLASLLTRLADAWPK